MKKGYTKQQASLISMKQQGGEQVAGNTNGYSNPLAKAQSDIEMERAEWDKAWNSKYNMGMGITDPNSVLNYQQRQPLTPMGSGLTPAGMVTPPTLEQSTKNALSTLQPINEEKRVEYVPNRVNIMNPSGNLSLDYVLNYAGRGFGTGNTSQAMIGTGLSILKGARNFLTGFSTGKEDIRVANKMKDEQFNRPKNFIPLQQGGEYENILQNKKINTYFFNKDTEMYDVYYEE
jgi:hypothetical protein